MLGAEPQSLAYMGTELYHKTNLASETRVLKFVLNKACPTIGNLSMGSGFCQFFSGKKSNVSE